MEEIKQEFGCVVCGAAYQPPLKKNGQSFIQMHHLEPLKRKAGGKRKNINHMGGWTNAMELAKCVPVCRFCHGKLHKGTVHVPENVRRFTAEEIYERRFKHGQQLAPKQAQYKDRVTFDALKREKAQRLYEQTGRKALA
jgi:hypothetical protein